MVTVKYRETWKRMECRLFLHFLIQFGTVTVKCGSVREHHWKQMERQLFLLFSIWYQLTVELDILSVHDKHNRSKNYHINYMPTWQKKNQSHWDSNILCLIYFLKGGCYKFLSLHVNFIIIEIIMSLFLDILSVHDKHNRSPFL
jgi:hypothetical protein